jgi:hypothetical protein
MLWKLHQIKITVEKQFIVPKYDVYNFIIFDIVIACNAIKKKKPGHERPNII